MVFRSLLIAVCGVLLLTSPAAAQRSGLQETVTFVGPPVPIGLAAARAVQVMVTSQAKQARQDALFYSSLRLRIPPNPELPVNRWTNTAGYLLKAAAVLGSLSPSLLEPGGSHSPLRRYRIQHPNAPPLN